LTVGLFAALLVALLVAVRRLVGPEWIYPLDDSYIHLAMARNLVDNQTWGISPGEFGSTSSSPVWTLVVAAAFRAFGAHAFLALVLAAAAALLAIGAATRASGRLGATPRATGWIVSVVVLVSPLAPLAMTGLEHTLHLGLAIVLAGRFTGLVLGEKPRASTWVLIALAVLVRYESLFLVCAAALLLARKRALDRAASIVVPACASVAAFGTFSVLSGGAILPNGVLGKSPCVGLLAGGDPRVALSEVVATVIRTPHLTLGCIAAAIVSALPVRPALRAWLQLSAGAGALHLLAARTGWLYRYEAYLMALLTLGCGAAAVELVTLGRGAVRPRPVLQAASRSLFYALALTSIVAAGFAAKRALGAHLRTPLASRSTFEQPVQVGRFLARFAPGSTVLVHDIGAVAWFSRCRVIDVGGLGTQSIAPTLRALAKTRSPLPADTLEAIARRHGVDLAILGEDPRWFEPWPASWTPLARWRIRDNAANASDTMTFLSIDAAHVDGLSSALEAMTPHLPHRVAVSLVSRSDRAPKVGAEIRPSGAGGERRGLP
jgi:hypothetical protein